MSWTSDRFLREVQARQNAAIQKFGLRVVSDVVFADEPVSLADAYAHLRIDSDSFGSIDDSWLTMFIPVARAWCEAYLGVGLATRTVELSSDSFPAVTLVSAAGPYFELPMGPVQSIVSVTYEDSNGDDVEIADTSGDRLYELDNTVSPARLVLLYGEDWPTDVRTALGSVKVRYITGYIGEENTNGDAVIPPMAKGAVLELLAYWYANRGDAPTTADVPFAVTAMLDLVPGRERLGMA